METDLARRAPPAMAEPVRAARTPRPAGRLGVRLDHRAQRLDAGRQAEPIKDEDTSSHALPIGAFGIALSLW